MSTARRIRRVGALAVVGLLALGMSACGTEPTRQVDGPTTQAFPVTIQAANGPVVIDARPTRIVSLSPTSTEMLFAVEAGSQVVAVDEQSDYPPEAPTTKLSSYTPNVEAIARYEPDLVIASSDAELKNLGSLKIPLLVHPAATTLDESYEQIEQIGAATGHPAEATREIDSIRSGIDEILASAPRFADRPSFYHELDDTYYSVTSNTFIGQIYKLAGLDNIADEAATGTVDYPQLSAEYIVQADPDFIFLADSECCGQTPETVAARAGWDGIAAVRNGAVVAVGDDLASRWGPRVVDFLRIVVDALGRSESGAR